MVETTLIISSLGASIAGGMFLAAGLNVRKRQVSEEAAPAVQLLAVWWLGLTVFAVATASIDLTMALGVNPLEILLAFHYARIIALCIGLWGLLYHLAYVVTGRRAALAPLAVFMALYYGAILFFVTIGRPALIAPEPLPRLEMTTPLLIDSALAGTLMAAPPLVAAFTYLGLLLTTRDAPQRLRIVLVSLATASWFAGALVRETALTEAWQPIVLGLLAALATAWAYDVPQWLRARVERSWHPLP